MSDDERAIRVLVDTWMAASQAGDITTVLHLMADDVVFMVPGRPPYGKDAFRTASQSMQGMQGMQFEGGARIEELKVLGNWAYVRNYIDLTVTPPGAAPVKRSGYTLTVLRKEADGQWRVARDANLVL